MGNQGLLYTRRFTIGSCKSPGDVPNQAMRKRTGSSAHVSQARPVTTGGPSGKRGAGIVCCNSACMSYGEGKDMWRRSGGGKGQGWPG